MTLQFIDQSAIGRGPSKSDRRIIRSHVMKGKNANKPRRSTKRATAITHVGRLPTFPHRSRSGYLKIGRQLFWNDLCLTIFPQQLDSESTKLMHRCTYDYLRYYIDTLVSSSVFTNVFISGFFDISDALFPPQFCSKFDMIKSIWVNCILADEACEEP